MKKIKIIVFDYNLPLLFTNLDTQTGGVAVELFHWIKVFDQIGLKIGILTSKGFKNNLIKKNNFTFIEAFDKNGGIPKLRFLYRLPKLFFAIKKFNPDFIVQEGAIKDIGLLAIVAKLLGKPFIHRIASDSDVDKRIAYKLSGFKLLSYKIGLRLADKIICQNDYQHEALDNIFSEKTFKLHNPFHIDKNIKIKKKNDRSYILWIGRFSYIKNIPALLDVVKNCTDIKFKIAGKFDVSVDKKTISSIEHLKKSKNVEFLGYIDNSKILETMSNAYALLNTSFLEGFSNTFLEAWSIGTPIVSTKNVNPDNVITNYNLGLVADSYNDLSTKVKELVSYSEKDYHELSIKCSKYVKDFHSPLKLADEFIQIISTT